LTQFAIVAVVSSWPSARQPRQCLIAFRSHYYESLRKFEVETQKDLTTRQVHWCFVLKRLSSENAKDLTDDDATIDWEA